MSSQDFCTLPYTTLRLGPEVGASNLSRPDPTPKPKSIRFLDGLLGHIVFEVRTLSNVDSL